MAFGLNKVALIGRLGADAEIVALANGNKIAKLRVCTDESYISKPSGKRVDAQEWHQVVTFSEGLASMFQKHGRKGRLIYVEGKLQTRRYRKDGEQTDRHTTEIMIVPGSQVSFLDKPDATGATQAAAAPEPAGLNDGGIDPDAPPF